MTLILTKPIQVLSPEKISKEEKRLKKWAKQEKLMLDPTIVDAESVDIICIEGRIFLGSYIDGATRALGLKKFGVTHVLTVGNGMPIPHEEDFTYKVIQIDDLQTENISRYFDECFDFITKALDENSTNKVLVHCWAGISRSATIVICVLARLYNESFLHAFEKVRKSRHRIKPNPGFQQQLLEYLSKNYGLKNEPEKVSQYNECLLILKKMYKQTSISDPDSDFVINKFCSIFGKVHPFTLDVKEEIAQFK